ncbi:hypothetical protein D1BOALGB6SA_8012 [Olavius sp. associated proteobacterium Delta 1]|nr:hypothetical protein D1BOALGB6SA_8012 [Olavius sp. associated proteobacterium Delta 1]
MILFRLIIFQWFGLVIFISNSYAYDITDKFSVGGVLSGAYQYQSVDEDDNKDRGAVPFQSEFSFRPTGKDEIFTGFGFAAGNGLNTSPGEGNYRLIVDGTSKQFLDEDGNKEGRLAAFLSFDQELGGIFGAWIRFGWQDDKALIHYDALYSGGLNITGKWYGREDDNIGIGYAYLNGKNDFDYTQVAEVYWRFVLNDYFAGSIRIQRTRCPGVLQDGRRIPACHIGESYAGHPKRHAAYGECDLR